MQSSVVPTHRALDIYPEGKLLAPVYPCVRMSSQKIVRSASQNAHWIKLLAVTGQARPHVPLTTDRII